MQLKTSIFIWVALATLVPMTALILAATSYSERLYREKVDREVITSLHNFIAEIDRRLRYERQTFQSLIYAPALEQYVPVLRSAAEDRIHPEFFERTDRINDFLEAFQSIVPALSTLRVLDAQANSLVKVRGGRSTPAAFDGIESFPYAEEELDTEQYIPTLRDLVPNEVGVTLLRQTRLEQTEETSLPMLDYIIPLSEDGQVIGYLVANTRGEQIDRIMDFAPRLNEGRLLIAEINPEQPLRDGVLLYDDQRELRFSDIKSTNVRVGDILGGRLLAAVQQRPEGMINSPDGKEVVYYIEYLPYPNLLVSWAVATRIDKQEIAAPFRRIRLAIWLFAAIALVLALWLVRMSAGRIARPVASLSATFKAYAAGDHSSRVQPSGSDEIRQLASSFNEMADTLDKAQEERDRAQGMMLQNAKMASIGEMAAGIGHEINNPLNNILSLTKLIERELPESESRLRSDVGSLREEALRASQIVKGVLNFARQVPPRYSRFAAGEWIAETLPLVQQEANRRVVHLAQHVPEGCMLEGDRGQLQQALVNLLLNAIQASPRGGRVDVTVERDAQDAHIVVRDRGPGIDRVAAEKIFDPFFTTKPVGQGSGLGLSITLGIVEYHGGRLNVDNDPEQGVVASITLPQAQAGEPGTQSA